MVMTMRCFSTFVLVLLSGCAEQAAEQQTVPGRWYTESQLAAGERLYSQHCAACHGADGSATEEWRQRDASGHFPPPPLNGTAHTWHHPLSVLDATIAEGGQAVGGVMPGFAAILAAGERRAIVAWIQSLWPDEIYARWAEIDARSR